MAVERVADRLDRAVLVVALDDRRSITASVSGMRVVAALDQQFQLVAGVEALDLPRRVAGGVVPDPVLVAVGVEDHRPPPELCLQAVGVQLGLLLADLRALRGPLRLDHRQRQPVGAPQHVVDEPLAVVVRHAGDLVLAVPLLGQRPAGLGQQHVDEQVAGLGLGVVAVVDLAVGGLGRLDLLAQLGDLGVVGGGQLVLLGQRLGVRLVLRLELRGELGDLLPRTAARPSPPAPDRTAP